METLTDFLGVGIGEVVHKKMNGPQAEALIVRRQRVLQLLVVDQATPVLIGDLEASDDVWIGSGRKRRRYQRRERAAVTGSRGRVAWAGGVVFRWLVFLWRLVRVVGRSGRWRWAVRGRDGSVRGVRVGLLGWSAVGSGVSLGLLGRRCTVGSGGAVRVWWRWLAVTVAGGLVWIAWHGFLVSLFLDRNFLWVFLVSCGVSGFIEG